MFTDFSTSYKTNVSPRRVAPANARAFCSFVFLLLSIASASCQSPAAYTIESTFQHEGKTFHVVGQDGKKGVMDASKKIIVPVQFDEVSDFPFGIQVAKGERYGLYSYRGLLLFRPVYDGFYNPYGINPLLKVVDSVSNHLYVLKDNAAPRELIAHPDKPYALNDIDHRADSRVPEGSRLFWLRNRQSGRMEKIFMLNNRYSWKEVTGNKKWETVITEFVSQPNEIPEAQ